MIFSKKIVRFVLLIFPSCAFCIVLFHFAGPFYARVLLPVAGFQMNWIGRGYENVRIELLDNGSKKIRATAIYYRKVPERPDKLLGARTAGQISASTAYILPIIAFSLILAWPYLPMRERLKSLLVMAPFMIVAGSLDLAVGLIQSLERNPVDYAAGDSIRYFLFYTFNNGGRQFLAVVVFLMGIAPFHVRRFVPVSGEVGRNDPCPCGSGKKFKKCCM